MAAIGVRVDQEPGGPVEFPWIEKANHHVHRAAEKTITRRWVPSRPTPSDARRSSTLQLLHVILGLLESSSRGGAIRLDCVDLLAAAQGVDNGRRTVRERIELNPFVLQKRVELRLQPRQSGSSFIEARPTARTPSYA